MVSLGSGWSCSVIRGIPLFVRRILPFHLFIGGGNLAGLEAGFVRHSRRFSAWLEPTARHWPARFLADLVFQGVLADEQTTARHRIGNRPLAFDRLHCGCKKQLVCNQTLALPESVGRQEKGVCLPDDGLSEEFIPQECQQPLAAVARFGNRRTAETMGRDEKDADAVEPKKGVWPVQQGAQLIAAAQATESPIEPQAPGYSDDNG
jgi:hypothetical protein